MGYFTAYQEIDERNRKTKEIQRTRQTMQKERQQATDDVDSEINAQTLFEKERQRRLQEIPKFRPADQIDISDKQMQLLKDIYDAIPKSTAPSQENAINTIDFFIATRKNPQLRTISTTIARDPEGFSRI